MVIEDLGDTDLDTRTVLPSSVLEQEDRSSLLYLLDDAGAHDAEDEFDALMEDDMLATVFGQRILAMAGHDVDDSVLSLGQLLLGGPSRSTLQEFRARHPGRLALYRQKGETYVLPQLRNWDLMPSDSDSSSRTKYHVLPGGYVSAVTYAETDDDDGEVEDEEDAEEEDVDNDEEPEDDDRVGLILHGDDDYMDWLGEQLLNRKSGMPVWIIDAVRESPDEHENAYTLIEASALTSKDGFL